MMYFLLVFYVSLIPSCDGLQEKEEVVPKLLARDATVITATASSVWNNNIKQWGPQLAWSGRSTTDVGFFHSKFEDKPWLQLHLTVVQLHSITIINRKDSCGERLKNLEVRAGMSPGLGNEVVGSFKGPGYTGGEHVIPFKETVTFNYITFQLRDRGILQINGIKVDEGSSVIAAVITATASSVLADNIKQWGPQLAWSGRSTTNVGFFHSKFEDKPWLQLHLTVVQLHSITIINRKDSCGERLKNLEVRAGLSTGLGNKVVGTFEGPGYTGGEHVISFKETITFDYITFQLRDKGMLQINGIKLDKGSRVVTAVITATASSVLSDNIKLWGPQLAWSGRSTRDIGFFHSKPEDKPWLQLHLTVVQLYSITIINRKDCCGERLKNLEVRAGMSPWLGNEVVGTFKGPGHTGGEHVIQFKETVTFNYITFQLKDRGILQINGIKVDEDSRISDTN